MVPTEEERRGRLIRRLREQKLWNRETLAKKAGVSTTTVVDSEEGRTRMRIGTASKLAEALDEDPLRILHPPLDEVRLPIDVDRISQEVLREVRPETHREYREALDERFERELSHFTTEELFQLKDDLLLEMAQISEDQRGSREDLRNMAPEGNRRMVAVSENTRAILQALDRAADRELTE